MSLPEVLLWRFLRGKPSGVKFRRQHPVGDFVLDFYCADKRVGIEIDGIADVMDHRPEMDARRDAIIRAMGIDVIRIAAADVLRDVETVAASIVRLCADRPPPSSLRDATSPMGGGFSGVFP